MESLFARASEIGVTDCTLPSGQVVTLRRIVVRFGKASPEYLPHGALPDSYVAKPLVTFSGAAMFGELAVVRWLEVDGWHAVWLDTVHGRKVWREMPTRSSPVVLLPAERATYDRIVAANGGRASGTFDVMAWKDGHVVFLEYQGAADRVSKTTSAWIEAALSAGVSQNDLFIVQAAPN